MKVFVDALHGDVADAVAVAAAGGVLRWRGKSPGVPVLRVLGADDPDWPLVAPGDVVLLDAGDVGLVARVSAVGADPWVVVQSPQQVAEAIAAGAGCWCRGLEGGGPVSAHAGLVLLRAAEKARFALVGCARRARSAAAAVGAAAVILDVQTWLTAGSPLCDAHRDALTRATTGRDTVLNGELDDRRSRWLSRGRAARAAASATEASPAWWLDPSAAVPAPQSLAEASRFAGQVLADVVRAVVSEALADQALIAKHHPLRPGCDPLGTGHPVVQGPMANVAEKPALAAAVAAAGGLPFVALGALRPAQAEQVLADAAALGVPWGAGIIGFDVMPHRDAHIELVRTYAPSAVIVAGGSPELAVGLEASGIPSWLHTPSGGLAERALAAGVATIVLEGAEAGGHVGKLTSIGLWEEGLAAVEAHHGSCMVVLAGGIGDTVSAAFAAAMASPAAATGASVVLQAGTAFFFTPEIVAAGQLTAACQQAALDADRTVLVGSSVNLPLRCAPGPFTDEARGFEQAWERDGLPRAERRQRLEHHNLGRTRVAAKGLTRDEQRPGHYREVGPDELTQTGAFTMGGGAVVTRHLVSVDEVVQALSTGAAARLVPRKTAARWGDVQPVAGAPSELPPAPRHGTHEPIAIIGLGCILPGALSVEAFWDLLLDGVDAVTDVPPERWRTDRYYDPIEGGPNTSRTTSKLAGLVRGYHFDPLAFRIPPLVASTIDLSQRMALSAAAEAVRSAGLHRGVDKQRAAVVLGNAMGGEFAKSLALRVRFREVLDVLDELGALSHLAPEVRDQLDVSVEARLSERLPPIQAETMSGLLANVIAGRVAAWLDWMGGNLTVDAACAASLAAVTVAVDWLRSGRADVVLTGGVDTDLSAESYVGFSRTQALSSGRSRPFSASADGFVMGEGAAVLALKRLSDARRDGDAVWGVIRGVGQASDGRARGITAPRAEGQRLAIDRAWADAGLDPRQAAIAEAHGTGTSLGDRTEVGVLADVFGDGPPTWLGSVKSNLGHLKGGAAAAALVKTTLALATGVVPASINAGPVSQELGLAGRSLRIPRWPALLDSRRTAGVSAFGFGGTDFHVVIEAPSPDLVRPSALAGLTARARERVVDAPEWPLEAAEHAYAWGADSLPALQVAVAEGEPQDPRAVASLPHRLVGITTDLSDLRRRAARWLGSAPVLEQDARQLGDALFRGVGSPSAVVVLVPGQGAQRRGAVASLRRTEAGRRSLEAIEAALPSLGVDVPRLDALEHRGADTAALHPLLYGLAVGWAAVLRDAGVPVAGAIGHSLGELGALVVAGQAAPAALLPAVIARGRALAACPSGEMLAIAAPESAVVPLLDDHCWLATLNGPRATVAAGADLAGLRARCAAAGLKTVDVPVAHAFHTPLVAPAAEALAAALASVPMSAGLPVWSGVSATALMSEPAPALVQALTAPVRFADAVRSAGAAGHRLFVELGPGRLLSGRVPGLVPGSRAIALDPRPDPIGAGTLRAAAALCAEGHPGLLSPAAPVRPPVVRTAPTAVLAQAAPAPSPQRAAQATAVQDLRIAALADPSQRPTYLAARADLLASLSADDTGLVGLPAPPAAVAPAVVASPRPSAPAPVLTPPPSPAATPSLPSVTSVRDAVIDVLCELTGYPVDFLEDDAQLEADLGVDSIKKMELVGTLQDRLGFVVDESDYADLAEVDLKGLVAYVEARTAGGKPSAPEPVTTADIRAFRAGWAEHGAEIPSGPPLPVGWTTHSGTLAWRGGDDSPAQVLAEWLRTAQAAPAPESLTVFVRPDHTADAAALGFARSWSRERGFALRAVITDDARLSSIAGPDPLVQLRAGRRLLPAAFPVRAQAAPLPPGAFWVATGGALGIVGPCIAALSSARVLLLGRTDPASSERLRAELSALNTGDRTVRYAVCDVTDAARVAEVVATARADWGPVQAVLHGAGRLRDGLVERLAPEDIATVLEVKLGGAAALIEATRTDAPALFCTFSSIVATTGNAGQTLYAAANAALETLRHPTADRTLHLGWTAWQDVGMAADPTLQAALARRGIQAVAPATGALAFATHLHADGVVQLRARSEPTASLPWPLTSVDRLQLGERARFGLTLDPSAPQLADHQLGGRPLVAGAVWIRALRDALDLTVGAQLAWALNKVAITAPTFVSERRSDVTIEVATDPTTGALIAEVWAGRAKVAHLSALPDAAERTVAAASPLEAATAASLYRTDLLFHGPSWQVLDTVGSDGNGTVQARLKTAPNSHPLDGTLDGVHQLLSAWAGARTGFLGLPIGAGQWWIAKQAAAGDLLVTSHVEAHESGVVGSVDVTDRDGRVVLQGREVLLQRAGAWPADGPTTLGAPDV